MNARGQEDLAYFNNYAVVQAFAYMIMRCEGTTTYGYYTLYGGTKISSLARHPNIAVTAGGWTSTAAGAFQYLYSTWAGLAAQLNLTDFSADSQNAAFVEILRQYGALTPLLNGDFQTALYKVRKVWASLPGAGYGQGERTLSQVTAWYNEGLQNGGDSSDFVDPTNSDSNNSTDSIDWNSPATLLIAGIFIYLILE